MAVICRSSCSHRVILRRLTPRSQQPKRERLSRTRLERRLPSATPSARTAVMAGTRVGAAMGLIDAIFDLPTADAGKFQSKEPDARS